VTSVSEVIAILLQLILYANTAELFCSLLELVSHLFVKGITVRKFSRRSRCVEEINRLLLGLFYEMMACKQAFYAYSVILDSFFYVYSHT